MCREASVSDSDDDDDIQTDNDTDHAPPAAAELQSQDLYRVPSASYFLYYSWTCRFLDKVIMGTFFLF